MSDDKREGQRSRKGEDKERPNDSGDRHKADGGRSSRRSENRNPSNDGSSRRSGRESRGKSDDRKSSSDDVQSSRNDRKSSRDNRKSSRDDTQSSSDDRKSSRDDGNDEGDRNSWSSRNDNDKRRTDRSMEEMIEANSILAEIAEDTSRYGDCLVFLTEVIHARSYLTDKQRDMLWSSFRNRTSVKRNSWRKCLELERCSDKGKKKTSATEYKNKLSKKIVANCKSVLTLIDDYLMPYLDDSSRGDEKSDTGPRIFYLKVKGDANRYMWEVTEDTQDRKKYEDEAEKSYERAYEKAVKDIGPAKPLRLGLALNYAVLYFEVIDKKDQARSLAKKASDDAEPEVDQLNSDDKMASESIIASLEHNINLWKKAKD